MIEIEHNDVRLSTMVRERAQHCYGDTKEFASGAELLAVFYRGEARTVVSIPGGELG